MKTALTIAGSDSSGGAGIQADLKTFSALGVYGMSVITAVTAQNTIGVRSVVNIPSEVIRDQMDAVFEDITVNAIKIGMLSSTEIISTVAAVLEKEQDKKIVLDPVMISKSGHPLLEKEGIAAVQEMLIPGATVITPNIPEAETLLGFEITTMSDLKTACKRLKKLGPENVLLKGGHLPGDPMDVFYDGVDFHLLHAKRIQTKNTHGTGCTLSSAITAYLALDYDILDAVKLAKRYVTVAIEKSLSIGKGHGPTHHFHPFY